MENVDLTSLALSDTSLVRLVTKGATPKAYTFTTATEMTAEEVIQEGEEKPLLIKGVLHANRPAEDTVLGHDLGLKDNKFTPEVLCLLQGGTMTKDENGKFKKYSAPAIGTKVNKEKFDAEIYTAVVSTDGETGEFVKTTYYNCVGQTTPLNFSDDNYFTADYKLLSRPAPGESTYDCEIVVGLPE